MIFRFYQIKCDQCGSEEIMCQNGNKLVAEAIARDNGWIFANYGKNHFCTVRCKKKFNFAQINSRINSHG